MKTDADFKYSYLTVYTIYFILSHIHYQDLIISLDDVFFRAKRNSVTNSGVSTVIIGKYERDEAGPSIDAAKKIADSLEVSLDNLVGEGLLNSFDKKRSSDSSSWNYSKKIKEKRSLI